MIQPLHIIVRGLMVLAIAFIVFSSIGLLILNQCGVRLLSVQTASMVPIFYPGDALLVVPIKPAEPKPGQVISYRSPANSHIIISHRLISVEDGKLTTAGDASRNADQPFSKQLVVGRAEAVLPKFGYVIDSLRRPLGLAAFIYLPSVLIIGVEVRQLSKSFNRVHYKLHARL